MKNIIEKIVASDKSNINLNVDFFTKEEHLQIRDFAKAANKTDLFFDFQGGELNVQRKNFVNAVEDGKINGVHIKTTDEGYAQTVRISSNNELIRIA